MTEVTEETGQPDAGNTWRQPTEALAPRRLRKAHRRSVAESACGSSSRPSASDTETHTTSAACTAVALAPSGPTTTIPSAAASSTNTSLAPLPITAQCAAPRLMQASELVLSGRRAHGADLEPARDRTERAERIGGDQLHGQRCSQLRDVCLDVRKQRASIGQSAVDVQQQMLELQGPEPWDLDRERHCGPSDEPDGSALGIDVDVESRGLRAETWHLGDLAAERHQPAGAGVRPDVADRKDEVRRRIAKRRVRRQ